MNVNNDAVLSAYAADASHRNLTILGSVVWFRVPDLRINTSEIQRAAIQTCQPLDDLPELCHPADAFRRATTSVTRLDRATRTRIVVRPVVDNTAEIVRAVVVERVDQQAQRLSHESTVYKFRFDKAQVAMIGTPVKANTTTTEDAMIAEVVAEAEAAYRELRQSLTGPDVTRWLMKRLKAINNVPVHPDGRVYFIPRVNCSLLESLGEFVNLMGAHLKDQSDHVLFATVPLPDTAEQRQVVSQGFTQSITGEIDAVVACVSELLTRGGDEFKRSTIEGKASDVADMRRRAGEYAGMLGTFITSELNPRFDLLEAQLDELTQRHAAARA